MRPAQRDYTVRTVLKQVEADYDREAEHDPRLGLDDPYRPFDIATRAIKLLYPGTTDDQIELPAFKNPGVPSALTIVKGYIEPAGGGGGRERTAIGGACPGAHPGHTLAASALTCW
jgi:hypothetical protein